MSDGNPSESDLPSMETVEHTSDETEIETHDHSMEDVSTIEKEDHPHDAYMESPRPAPEGADVNPNNSKPLSDTIALKETDGSSPLPVDQIDKDDHPHDAHMETPRTSLESVDVDSDNPITVNETTALKEIDDPSSPSEISTKNENIQTNSEDAVSEDTVTEVIVKEGAAASLAVHSEAGSSETGDAKKTERPNSVAKCDQELQQLQTMSQEAKAKQAASREQESSIYHLKWFEWKGEQTPIVTQNENGPCPLLAIANVLILARKIVLPKMQQLISGKQLMEYIGDCILSEAPEQEENKELLLNYQQNMHDAIDIMYKLQTGIDVNVKFSGVTEFEFTSECIVFDLLKIVLYHGWLVDPQDDATMKAINDLSYNQLVEKMLISKDSEGDKAVDGFVIEEFLNRTASQLTYHGLCELNSTIQEEELCVFFRNNHFSTLYKHKGELFMLVTDQGFLTEPAVTWETLVNIEGDGQFVNSEFKSVTLQESGFNNTNKTNTSSTVSQEAEPETRDRNMSQEDRDYLIALQLQQDEGGVPPTSNESNSQTTDPTPKEDQTFESDLALAMKLQEDEDNLAREHQRRQQQQQQQGRQQNQQQPQQGRQVHQQQGRQPTPQQRQHQQQLQRRPTNQSSSNVDTPDGSTGSKKDCSLM